MQQENHSPNYRHSLHIAAKSYTSLLGCDHLRRMENDGSARNSYGESMPSSSTPESARSRSDLLTPGWETVPPPCRSLASSQEEADPTPQPRHPPLFSVEPDASGVVEIRKGGTLTLVVGSNSDPRMVIVSAASVSLLSPIWADIILRHTPEKKSVGPFRTTKNEQITIRLAEDDPDMLILVMKIAHLQFRDVMEFSLSYPQLVELAVTSKRYDTNQILAPFLQRWCQLYGNRILSPGMEGWLYVAHQFGLEEDYVLLARHLVLNCTVDKDGELRTPVGHPFHGRFPLGALDRIKQCRRDLLINLLNTTYGHLENMVDQNTCQCTSTHQSNAGSTPPLGLESTPSLPNSTYYDHHISDTDRTNCTLLNYGTLVQKLKFFGYWPVLRTTACMRDSVTSIADLLSSIKVLASSSSSSSSSENEPSPSASSQAGSSTCRLAIPPTPTPGVKLSSAHTHCDAGLRLATKIQAVIQGMGNTVDEHTMLEVRQNRRKYANWPQIAAAKNWGVSDVRIPAPVAGNGQGLGNSGRNARDPEKRGCKGQRHERGKECGSGSGRRGSLCPWFNINQDIER